MPHDIGLMKKIRQKLGLTQAQFAILMGMYQPGISILERGINGRKVTGEMKAHTFALEVLHEHDLIIKLELRIKDHNRKHFIT